MGGNMTKKTGTEKGSTPSRKRSARTPAPESGQPPVGTSMEGWILQANELIRRRPHPREGLYATERVAAGGPEDAATAAPRSGQTQRVRARLEELRSWHTAAWAALEDLMSRRKPSELVAETLLPADSAERALMRAAHRLVSQLGKNALAMASLEVAQQRWHAARKLAAEAIRIRGEVAARTIGRPLLGQAVSHLKLSYAEYMLAGNSPKLRKDLGAALAQLPNSQSLAYWLARYEIMAGHYPEALAAIRKAPTEPRAQGLLRLIVDPASDGPAWISYPCNFYSYRYALADDEVLKGIYDAVKTESAGDGVRNVVSIAYAAMLAWNEANGDMARGRYSAAANGYIHCQRMVLLYFVARYPEKYSFNTSPQAVYSEIACLVKDLVVYSADTMGFWDHFRRRYGALDLDELRELDWTRPTVPGTNQSLFYSQPQILLDFLNPIPYPIPTPHSSLSVEVRYKVQKLQEKIEAPLLALGAIFVPLAIAETHRMRRDFDPALHELRQLLNRHKDRKILCEFIERPFVKIQLAQVLLEKGDAEYKGRVPSRTPKKNPDGSLKYQGLAAAEAYQDALVQFEDQGEYVRRVKAAAQQLGERTGDLLKKSFSPLVSAQAATGVAPPLLSPAERQQFEALGKEMPIATIVSRTGAIPGFEKLVGPHEPLLRFVPPDNQTALRETNPLVYAIVTEAQARLLQLDAGLNYLGYRDDYVPPWRFEFLLSRARYFAEHAKSAQRDYMNFLANAEREEFQELSAEQAVVLEKSSIRIETARVDQCSLEVEAAQQSKELSDLVALDAAERQRAYKRFDETAEYWGDVSNVGAVAGVGAGVAVGAAAGAIAGPLGAVVGGVVGGLGALIGGIGSSTAQLAQNHIAAAQRDYELNCLALAKAEAVAAAEVAAAQLKVVRAAVVVASLQRATALLRHEFAVQSLRFLRNRTLNAEMWCRLSHHIRGIANTYLRYAVEMAFLAEQAYEFQADKRVDVIRFDYDISEMGDMLAADFLLRDIDTLEQDLIVTQRRRQQPVSYVLSLAREFPQALQDLRDSGSTIFTLPLEKLERRFPGLYNLRVGAVDVMPVALMDPTRFSLELSHLGVGQMRLKNQAGSSVWEAEATMGGHGAGVDFFDTTLADTGNNRWKDAWLVMLSGNLTGEITRVIAYDGNQKKITVMPHLPMNPKYGDRFGLTFKHVPNWLSTLDYRWPARSRLTAPESVVFSGLTRAEQEATLPFVSGGQRDAFESRPAAAAWRIDMSMRENQVVPGTLADVLITFNIVGYHDPGLRAAIDGMAARPSVLTQWLSASQTFPDAFYEFTQSGVMKWPVTGNMLTIESVGALRNIGVIALPRPGVPQFGRLTCSQAVEFTVTAGGQVKTDSLIPKASMGMNALHFAGTAGVPNTVKVTWDFGDQTEPVIGKSAQHDYARPGKYEVTIRMIDGSRLYEYRAHVVASKNGLPEQMASPLAGFPALTTAGGAPAGKVRVVATGNFPSGNPATMIWRLTGHPIQKGIAQFDLEPGSYTLTFIAVRQLKAALYGRQRFDPNQRYDVSGLCLTSNRTFDSSGSETTVTPNELTTKLLKPASLSPVDEWTFVLPLGENPCLRSVTQSDIEHFDAAELADLALTMEYETSGN
jgi:hypothetical protein